jgi:hypothetical protein
LSKHCQFWGNRFCVEPLEFDGIHAPAEQEINYHEGEFLWSTSGFERRVSMGIFIMRLPMFGGLKALGDVSWGIQRICRLLVEILEGSLKFLEEVE